jgi:MHS family proline/betaine transporter-like MFS transporter
MALLDTDQADHAASRSFLLVPRMGGVCTPSRCTVTHLFAGFAVFRATLMEYVMPHGNPSVSDVATLPGVDARPSSGASPLEGQRTVGPRELRRVILASGIGSFVEWFEFSVYGYLAAIMGQIFFPASAPSTQLIASLAAFGIAFFARPFGGFVFGPIGDKFGRKRVLTTTLVLMALATFGIGIVPSFASIGVAAPIILVFLRLLQGLSAGGEASGASIYVAEYAADHRRTFLVSWLEFGCMCGFMFGAVLTAVLKAVCTPAQMLDWAWRIPFLLSLPLGAIGLYIRFKLEETPAFEATEQRRSAAARAEKFDWRGLFSSHWSELLQSGGVIIVTNVTLFIVVTYVPTYLVSNLRLTSSESLHLTLFGQALLIVTIPILGLLADRIGRRTMMLAGSIGIAALAVPCFHMLIDGSFAQKMLALVLMNLCLSCMLSCVLSKVPSLFATKVRFTGMAISYNVCVALFAGTAPMLNAWLIDVTGSHMVPAYYLIGGAVAGVIALLASSERTGQPMPGDAVNIA